MYAGGTFTDEHTVRLYVCCEVYLQPGCTDAQQEAGLGQGMRKWLVLLRAGLVNNREDSHSENGAVKSHPA